MFVKCDISTTKAILDPDQSVSVIVASSILKPISSWTDFSRFVVCSMNVPSPSVNPASQEPSAASIVNRFITIPALQQHGSSAVIASQIKSKSYRIRLYPALGLFRTDLEASSKQNYGGLGSGARLQRTPWCCCNQLRRFPDRERHRGLRPQPVESLSRALFGVVLSECLD